MKVNVIIAWPTNDSISVIDTTEYTHPGSQIGKYDSWKYSDTGSIDYLEQINTTQNGVSKSIVNTHKFGSKEVNFDKLSDGYYKLSHIILPTKSWWDKLPSRKDVVSGIVNTKEDMLEYYDYIYVLSDSGTILEFDGEDFVEISLCNFLDEVCGRTTIAFTQQNIFITAALCNCLGNYTEQVFLETINSSVCNKTPKIMPQCGCGQIQSIEEQTMIQTRFKRDYLQMALNIVEHFAEIGQYYEAQRYLEKFSNCTKYCKDLKSVTNNTTACGCNR